MPRQVRAAPGGYVYHALNRTVARMRLLRKDGDFDAMSCVLFSSSALAGAAAEPAPVADFAIVGRSGRTAAA